MGSRRFFTIISSVFIPILIFGIALLLYMSRLNVVELKFATYEEALAAGAFKNASLPQFLPKSARNIQSKRDLDASVSLVTFDFGNDFGTFLNQQVSSSPASGALARTHERDFSDPKDLKYFPLLSSEEGLYHGSLLINSSKGKAIYVEPPQK